jgi:hypothetical protein
MDENDYGKAVIEKGSIVIRVPIANLQTVVDGTWALNSLTERMKITNAKKFAAELVHALNDEDGEGTTPVHTMFDKCLNEAIEQGAEGVEVHEDQDI